MKTFIGQVVSLKMAKTAVVALRRLKSHPLYRKKVRVLRKFSVHDEMGTKVGDKVEFQGARPISKTKKWRITKILGKNKEIKKEK